MAGRAGMTSEETRLRGGRESRGNHRSRPRTAALQAPASRCELVGSGSQQLSQGQRAMGRVEPNRPRYSPDAGGHACAPQASMAAHT